MTDIARYRAAEETLKLAQHDASEARHKMTRLLSQVDDDILRQELMQTFHDYADATKRRTEASVALGRDGHA